MTTTLNKEPRWIAIETAKALGYAAGLAGKAPRLERELHELRERFGYIVEFAYNSEFDRGDRERRDVE